MAPVLVCLDDLQWAHPGTLLALRTLPRKLARSPVAWILARSVTREDRHGDLVFGSLACDGATRITLGPLGEEAVAGLLTGAFGAPPDLIAYADTNNQLTTGGAGFARLVIPGDNFGGRFVSNLTSLTIVDVPEPRSAVLLGLGVAAEAAEVVVGPEQGLLDQVRGTDLGAHVGRQRPVGHQQEVGAEVLQ